MDKCDVHLKSLEEKKARLQTDLNRVEETLTATRYDRDRANSDVSRMRGDIDLLNEVCCLDAR